MENFTRQTLDTASLPRHLLEKWSRPALSEGFVPFPKKLLRCMHRIFLGEEATKELAAVLAIVDFKRPNLTRLPSLEYLAFLAGLGDKEFEQILQRLEQKGLVKVQGERDGLDVSLDGLIKMIHNETK